jgi:hypothetical protein
MIVAHWERGTELNDGHSRTTSLAFLSSRKPMNLECFKVVSAVHSRPPDPDALAAKSLSRDVELSVPLKDTDDGLRGFELQDADGYVLFFRPSSLMSGRSREAEIGRGWAAGAGIGGEEHARREYAGGDRSCHPRYFS